MSDSSQHDLGYALARIRRRTGMTQEVLAERAAVSVSVIRKLERGARDSASLATLRKLASALGTTTVDLFDPTPAFDELAVDDRDDLYLIRRVLQPARRLGGNPIVTLADDDVPPTLESVARSVREINGMFRDSQYAAAVAALPSGVIHASAAAEAAEGDQQAVAWGHLAQLYQTAALVLIQLRRDDLAYHALGLAMDAGRKADAPMVAAAAVCGENWLLTRQARFDEAEQAALSTAEAVEPSFTRSPPGHVATWGWLNLGAAAAATRNNRPDVAKESLKRARAAAYVSAGYASPDVAQWTTFNPAVVAMRETELAMVTGDADRALRVARTVPANARPVVTHLRFRLDVVAAYLERHRADEAQALLVELRHAAPGWLRHQRYARSIAARLLRGRRSIPAELRELADFLEVSD